MVCAVSVEELSSIELRLRLCSYFCGSLRLKVWVRVISTAIEIVSRWAEAVVALSVCFCLPSRPGGTIADIRSSRAFVVWGADGRSGGQIGCPFVRAVHFAYGFIVGSSARSDRCLGLFHALPANIARARVHACAVACRVAGAKGIQGGM